MFLSYTPLHMMHLNVALTHATSSSVKAIVFTLLALANCPRSWRALVMAGSSSAAWTSSSMFDMVHSSVTLVEEGEIKQIS